MGVGFASLEIARSGMIASERGLTVTGHNITNVNTEGYVRQQAMITTGAWQTEAGGKGFIQFGLGADIQEIRQIRDYFLDNVYRQEVNNLGYWEAKNKTYEDMQTVLGEPMNTGLQNSVNDFWDSWQELSKSPESLTVRALVVQRGEALVEQINHVNSQIDKLQEDLDSEIKVRINEVNSITSQISELNLEILKSKVANDTPNDYMDQRNSLIDRLSELIDVDCNEAADGQMDITVGGYFLVSKGTSTNIVAGNGNLNGFFSVPMISGTNIELPLKSGTIKGLMEARGEVPGLEGGILDGSVNTKADIVFAIDVSNTSSGYLANLQSSIAKYVDELDKKGIDYNLRLVTYGSSVNSNANYGNNTAAFTAAIAGITTTADTGNNFGNVVTALNSISDFRTDANKYAVVFTAESVDGNEVATTAATVQTYANTLNAAGIKTSVVTDTTYYSAGSPAAETSGWNVITNANSDNLYDINSIDYEDLVTNINNNISIDINKEMSQYQETNNILVDLKKQLNAQINIILREVNYLQRSGKTLGTTPTDGDDFFVTINSAYPLELGNVRLNPNLTSLNNIVSSGTGRTGDNTVALSIANLRQSDLFSNNGSLVNADEYYQTIILNVGSGGSEAARIYENQQKLVSSADTQRQSISAVSMDEEMANMMKYQYSYSASAKVIRVMDEMLKTIVEKLGA